MDNLDYKEAVELSHDLAVQELERFAPPRIAYRPKLVSVDLLVAVFRVAYRLGERRECSFNLPESVKRLSDFHLASNAQIDAIAGDHIETLLRTPEVKHERKR